MSSVNTISSTSQPPSTAVTSTTPQGDVDSSTSGVPWPAASAIALGVALVSFWLARTIERRRQRRIIEMLSVPATTRERGDSVMVADPLIEAQRTTLIDGLIDLRDRIESPPLSKRIGSLLESVGVTTIDPVGDRFDARLHTAQVPAELTSDPSLDGRVADVVAYGYSERSVTRRLPVVIVHRFEQER